MTDKALKRIPEIKVLQEHKGSIIHYVLIDGDKKYKCISKEGAESIKDMAEALYTVYKELEACGDWGNDLKVSTIQKVFLALNKFGVNV